MRAATRPPRLAERLMERVLPLFVQRNGVVGDLREEYARRRARHGRIVSDLWFWRQAILVYWRFRAEARRRSHSKPGRSAGHMGMDLLSDVRFAFRSFRRSPGFAAATVLVLGIGIGAVSLMFSTFNTVVLQPLPFEAPDRLVWVWASRGPGSRNSLSYLDYLDYRQETDAWESLGAFSVFRRTRILTGDEEAQQVGAYHVSANLFATLGITPEIGRAFLPEEEETGREVVTILSHGFWQRRYGGDPTVIGTIITLNGEPAEIVGVMPAGFDYPAGTDMWLPLQQQAGYAQGRGNNNFRIVGRLRNGVTIDQAQAQMDVVASNIADAFPATKAGWGIRLVSLHERYFGSARATILMLIGIISLVPLVACANVASLFMARAATRKTELASRLALGASRGRVVRQLLSESLVVALGGGAVGLALAYGGGEALRFFAPAALPRLDSIGVDGNVLAFTLAASLLMIPLFGMAPALRATDMDIAETLKVGGRRASDRRSGIRSGLVVAQVALSLMLMLASGLFLRSFLNLQSTSPGFQAENVLSFRSVLPYFKYDTDEEIERVWDEVHGHLRAVPGVTAVGAIDWPPMSGSAPSNEVWAAGRPPADAAEAMGGTRRFASEGFFDAMRIPLLAGRVFETTDRRDAPPVTVINETLAQQFFPGENPVGKILVLDWATVVNLEVVGVTADVAELGVGSDPIPVLYLPARWSPRVNMYFLVRTQGDPLESARALRQAVADVDRDIPISAVQTMQARLSDSLFQPKFRSAVVGIFALVALILSSVGLYGVLACFVRQRGHEISIRMALGARTAGVMSLVLMRGLALVGLGLLIGLVGGLVGSRLIESVLFGVGAADPITYLGVGLSLVVVALVACIVPASRAVRMDPAEVLKAE